MLVTKPAQPDTKEKIGVIEATRNKLKMVFIFLRPVVLWVLTVRA